MTTKYPMPEPHVHAELMIAKANKAVIQGQNYNSDKWLIESTPKWFEDRIYRIDPTCDYAKAKIAELGGDYVVELYLYWLDGGELEFFDSMTYLQLNKAIDDPFIDFIYFLENYGHIVRKKKRIVKQVLWVHEWSGENHMHDCKWLSEDLCCESYGWHKVPSCIREIESDA